MSIQTLTFDNSLEKWQIYQQTDELVDSAVEYILQCAKEAIQARGGFNLVLAGGTTPIAIYKRLAQLSDEEAQFSKWCLFMGDERVHPAEHAERNSKEVHEVWLQHGQIPSKHVFMMPTELGLENSAKIFRDMIEGVDFDLVLLGMGEDGHTASLFPGHEIPENHGLVLETQSPKPPSERLSLSYQRINSAAKVLKLITGSAKYDVTQLWYQYLQMGKIADLPIAKIAAQQQTITMLDQQAFKLAT
jgi:6-phosphogluconolactonase